MFKAIQKNFIATFSKEGDPVLDIGSGNVNLFSVMAKC